MKLKLSQKTTHMSRLRPQSAVRYRDAHLTGYSFYGCVAHTGKRGDAGDPTSSLLQLNDRPHRKFSFNFRHPEMANPFRW